MAPGRIREASRASLSTDQPSPSSSSALRSATRSISGSVASPSDVQATRRGRDLSCPGRVATHISGVTPAPPAAPPAPPVVLAETRFLDHGNFGGLQHPKVSVIKEPAWLRPESRSRPCRQALGCARLSASSASAGRSPAPPAVPRRPHCPGGAGRPIPAVWLACPGPKRQVSGALATELAIFKASGGAMVLDEAGCSRKTFFRAHVTTSAASAAGSRHVGSPAFS